MASIAIPVMVLRPGPIQPSRKGWEERRSRPPAWAGPGWTAGGSGSSSRAAGEDSTLRAEAVQSSPLGLRQFSRSHTPRPSAARDSWPGRNASRSQAIVSLDGECRALPALPLLYTEDRRCVSSVRSPGKACRDPAGQVVVTIPRPHSGITACYSRFAMSTGSGYLRTIGRRGFICTALAAGSLSPIRVSAGQRRFYSAFVPGSLGVAADQALAIELAAKHGFASVQPFPGDLLRDGVGRHVEALKKHQLRWAAAGLPVDFRQGDAEFDDGLAALPRQADALQAAGVTRVGTWLRPSSDTLTYMQNMKRTADRLRKVASVLQDRNLRLGLEYVGTKRNWTAMRYSFVHTMAETKDLIAEIGVRNVGIVLDSWHWWTSGETGSDIRTLSNSDVVSADLNDAPAGIERDEQYDNQRELPLATGVINIRDFLEALVDIGYDGPIRAEPFNRELREMDDDRASRITGQAMTRAFALVD